MFPVATILRNDPSKAEEIAHWIAFYNALPQGCYLRSILKGLDGMIADRVYNDFGHSIVDEIAHLYTR